MKAMKSSDDFRATKRYETAMVTVLRRGRRTSRSDASGDLLRAAIDVDTLTHQLIEDCRSAAAQCAAFARRVETGLAFGAAPSAIGMSIALAAARLEDRRASLLRLVGTTLGHAARAEFVEALGYDDGQRASVEVKG
jgi:hypothetical protein